jgi:hypothetical protein
VTNVPENKVHEAGILRLYEHIFNDPVAKQELTAVPQSLLSKSFLQRLLEGMSLKSFRGSDLSGAQRDLRMLTLEQLLSIRHDSLDFSTAECEAYNSHHNFLRTVELHLFDKLAKQYLRNPSAKDASPSQLYSLGLDVAMVLGVAELLAENDIAPEDTSASPISSPIWAFKLDQSEWPGQVAVFHTSELWIEVLAATGADFSTLASGNLVNVMSDKTTGLGRQRVLDCAIIALDPSIDDLVPEMNRVDRSVHLQLSKEMEAALVRRKQSIEQGTTMPLPAAPRLKAKLAPRERTEKRASVADQVKEWESMNPQTTSPPRQKQEDLVENESSESSSDDTCVKATLLDPEPQKEARRALCEAYRQGLLLQTLRKHCAVDHQQETHAPMPVSDKDEAGDSMEDVPDLAQWLEARREKERHDDSEHCECCGLWSVRSPSEAVDPKEDCDAEPPGLFETYFGYFVCCTSRDHLPRGHL